jgi:hypothetical protein
MRSDSNSVSVRQKTFRKSNIWLYIPTGADRQEREMQGFSGFECQECRGRGREHDSWQRIRRVIQSGYTVQIMAACCGGFELF